MKQVPVDLQNHLDTGYTTVCHCWKVTRLDAQEFGFTDHDKVLTFGGVDFEPGSGFTPSDFAKELGFQVDNMTSRGALSSDAITEADIRAGLWDDATIELYLVNWNAVAQRVLISKNTMGQITRGSLGYQADMVGQTFILNQPRGRLHSNQCDAEVGDARCGVDLEDGAFKGTGEVSSVIDQRRFVVTGLGAYADTWFSLGTVTWLTGDNADLVAKVKRHTKTASQTTIELWIEMPEGVDVGDDFEIRAGCDRYFNTCGDKFNNRDNFRGFPHILGTDNMALNAGDKDNMDGSSRYSN